MDTLELTTKYRKIKNQAFFKMNQKIEEAGLTKIEFYLLFYVDMAGSIQASSLAKHFQVSIPAVMHKLSALEQKGFVKKVVDSKDKRIKYYSITDSFSAYYKNIFHDFKAQTKAYLEFLGEERAHLDRILDLTLAFLEVKND